MENWLDANFDPIFEYPVGRRFLDVALWRNSAVASHELPMDYALEWEWDDNKVHRDFPGGDFTKVIRDASARCGIAIVQTRIDGNRALNRKAEETLRRLRDSLAKSRTDGRPVGVIEIRRTHQSPDCSQFSYIGYDLDAGKQLHLGGKDFRA
jgi:hypothetical protein